MPALPVRPPSLRAAGQMPSATPAYRHRPPSCAQRRRRWLRTRRCGTDACCCRHQVTVSGLKPGALGLKAFTFAPRTQKLNWRALSQVNLDKVKREVNIDTLQEYLEMVAFANAAGADVSQYADPNFVKVFQLAQLMIEYSLYSQEVIDEARLNLQQEFETQKAKADKAVKSEKELKDQVAMLKKELKLQRKTIAVYEDRLTKVMNNEAKMKQTTTQLACQICGKMFATPAYLTSHMSRRHTMFPGANALQGGGYGPHAPGGGMGMMMGGAGMQMPAPYGCVSI